MVIHASGATAAIMLQGTGSDVGKSLLVAGLCRAYLHRGLAVRPFKPQNMSNNAAVTADGGEVGRAQALQALACGVPVSSDMNPVLLKPQSDSGAQVIVQGKVWGSFDARAYQEQKSTLMPSVLESFGRLCDAGELVIVEGAGSPAEVNLRVGDIANMGFAEVAEVPVALVADIDRGGVIASIVGTHAVLPESERRRIKGCIINKFRGDVSLFNGGLKTIAEATNFETFGVVPYFPAARRLPAEDSVAISSRRQAVVDRPIRVAVPVLSRISNFDDLDPLIAEADVMVDFVEAGRALPGDADLVVLPGTKSTLTDLAFLRAQGWDIDIAAHHRRGGMTLGICGGYQMLGRRISDPEGIEGAPGVALGLGLLDIDSEIKARKSLREVQAIDLGSGESLRGYEMHMGVTTGPGLARPLLSLGERQEGAVSESGRVLGCYLHGLFAADNFRHAFLSRLRDRHQSGLNYEMEIEETLDALAVHLESHLNLDRILQIAKQR